MKIDMSKDLDGLFKNKMQSLKIPYLQMLGLEH
jgi:hypothetical protein